MSRATANRYPAVLEEYRLALRARESASTPPDDREALRRLEAQYKADRTAWSAREAELEATAAKYAQQIQYLSMLLERDGAGPGNGGASKGSRILPINPRR